jgi:hypothetical protein
MLVRYSSWQKLRSTNVVWPSVILFVESDSSMEGKLNLCWEFSDNKYFGLLKNFVSFLVGIESDRRSSGSGRIPQSDQSLHQVSMQPAIQTSAPNAYFAIFHFLTVSILITNRFIDPVTKLDPETRLSNSYRITFIPNLYFHIILPSMPRFL